MILEWNIQSRAHACSACGKSFVDKQSYHTLLYDERADLRRLDVCDACWQSQHSNGGRERKGFVSYWHGIYEAPTPPADPIQKENAESLLRKLIELKDPSHGAAAYILAVMLERKRLLKVKEEILRDGQRIFVYEQPKTGDVFTIADPALQLNQLDAVQREVADLLEHGLTPPAAAAPMPGDATAADAAGAEPAPVVESPGADEPEEPAPVADTTPEAKPQGS
jgi:hypothetical protein